MTDSPPTDERTTLPFAAVLQQINNGHTHRDLSEQLQALTAAVKETGKKGSLILRLDLSESKAAGALDVTATVKATLPQPKQFSTIFYVDGDDNLVRTNPLQAELDFGPVKVAGAPGKAANQ